MKKIVLFSSLIFGLTLFNEINAEADAISGQDKETKTKITIIEDTSNDPTKGLELLSVPSDYNFSAELSKKEYTVSSGKITEDDEAIKEGIVVFNSQSKRDWSVKANVVNNELSNSKSQKFEVNSFVINNKEVVGTGNDGIVAISTASTQKTGIINTEVNNVSIKFTDNRGLLRENDVITGAIKYVLYNTLNAE